MTLTCTATPPTTLLSCQRYAVLLSHWRFRCSHSLLLVPVGDFAGLSPPLNDTSLALEIFLSCCAILFFTLQRTFLAPFAALRTFLAPLTAQHIFGSPHHTMLFSKYSSSLFTVTLCNLLRTVLFFTLYVPFAVAAHFLVSPAFFTICYATRLTRLSWGSVLYINHQLRL
jgi:hypothetical protein